MGRRVSHRACRTIGNCKSISMFREYILSSLGASRFAQEIVIDDDVPKVSTFRVVGLQLEGDAGAQRMAA